jgi:hypothetical protein
MFCRRRSSPDRRRAGRRRPPRASLPPTCRFPPIPAQSPSFAVLPRIRHGVLSHPLAAMSSPHDLSPCLPSRLSSSAQPDQEDTETSFALLSPSPCKLPAPIASAARSSPPAKHWLPWAATIKHSSPPSTPLRASPFPARAHRPPIALQLQPEPCYRRTLPAAASGSPWNTHLRPSSTLFDHAPSFLTPPGNSLTTASSPLTTGLPP